MKCSICGHKTKVIDVRTNNKGIRVRKRECLDEECKFRETTHELSQIQILERLDEVLPYTLVDEISWALELVLPERDVEPTEIFDFYFHNSDEFGRVENEEDSQVKNSS